jgi:eukaryotic-like serine/threonine-protein kinase
MLLAPGTRLGPFEILAPLGAGGMGEVYRARDTRLGRDVAVKVSAEQFTERFEREARVIASLNHGNVCHLYDIGPNYLVMELIEGETLGGPHRFEEALPLIRQLIDGIEAAHDRNIVHRDLKPSNIKVTHDGVVKILDFGLAKASSPEPEGGSGSNPEHSPTMTIDATTAGTILGTAAYMAPEQAKGKTADKRSDIWAFGVVVYELLTGKKPFQGESVVETLGAVINQQPDWPPVPDRARRLLKWCLEKDRKHRLQAIGDARGFLEEEIPDNAPVARRTHWLWPAAALMLLAALAGLAFVHFREPRALTPETSRFELSIPASALMPALSPDGRKITFAASGADGVQRLWVRAFDSLDARPLPDTEDPRGIMFWSRDSRQILFQSAGKLKRIDAAGGLPRSLCNVPGLIVGGAETRDGVIVFGNDAGGVMKVSDAGGPCAAITALDPARGEVNHLHPSLLPDDQHFIYLRDSSRGKSGLFIGSLDAKPEEQSSKQLLATDMGAQFFPSADSGPGRLLFFREGTLLAQPFDTKRMELAGEATPVASQIAYAFATPVFSASNNGVLVYATTENLNYRLTWFDRHGQIIGRAGAPGFYRSIAVSPDGKRVVFSTYTDRDLWLMDLSRGDRTRFTFGAFFPSLPVWSPDGTRIAFGSRRGNAIALVEKPSNNAEEEKILLSSDEEVSPLSWSRDGRFLLYQSMNPKTKSDLWVLPLQGDRKPFPFLRTDFNEQDAAFSPDGHWVAYTSDESGRNEVYVRPFSSPPSSGGAAQTAAAAAGKWLISNGGGSAPLWRADGKELWYRAPDDKEMSVTLTTAPVVSAGTPNVLFQFPPSFYRTFTAITSDGNRFLTPIPESETAKLQVVLNWQAGLKQ